MTALRLRRHLRRAAVLAAALWLVACSGPPSSSPEPRDLPLGSPMEADLRPGEVHRYRVALHAGRGIAVIARQVSIDVVLALHAQGKEIAQGDTQSSGEDVLLAVAPVDGSYEVRVRAVSEKVPQGRYGLSVEEIAGNDPRRSGFDHHLEARGLGGEKDPRGELAEASRAWEASGERRMAAHALLEMGRQSSKLKEPMAAVPPFREAARLFSDLGLTADGALTANLHSEALAEQGEYRAACDVLKSALPEEPSLTPADRVALRCNYGSCLKEVGDYAASLEALQRVIPEFQDLGMNADELIARTALADIFLMQRDLPAALAELTRGVTLSREYARPETEARFLQRLGILYSEAGDLEAAADHWRRSLSLHHAAGNRTGEAAVLMQLGDQAAKLGDSGEAERSYRQALEMMRSIGQKMGESRALRRLANLLIDRGEYARAAELHEHSLEILRKLDSAQGQVLTLAGLARAQAGAGHRAKAMRSLRSALALSRESAAGIHQAQLLGELALLDRDRGALKEALHGLDETIELLEAEQRAALVPSLQATLSGDAQRWYAERTDLLLRAGRAEAALECSERARARALLGLLAESHVDVRQGVDPALLERYRALQVRLSQADRAQAPEVVGLNAQLDALETEIRRSSPVYAALTQPRPLEVEDIKRRVLDDGTLLLEFALGKERSWVFALGTDGLVTAPLGPAAEIEAAAERLHRRLSTRGSGGIEAAALSDLLLRPLAARLTGAWRGHRLAIVPDGALQYVPFGVLPLGDPARPLIEDHEIAILPSASVLHVMRRQVAGRPPAPGAVALVGDPVFDATDPRVRRASGSGVAAAVLPGGTRGFPRLPFSRDEVKSIAALLPASQVLQATDFRASRAFVMEGALDHYRILHVSTHGLLNTTQPQLSGVVLSLVDERGHPQDGFLRLQDIYNLHLSADLVVLSACQTALGRKIAGEGLVGLTRGFMHAGSPRVVASLWRVDDSATAELMTDFYRGMLKDGLPAAAALRAAQRKLASDRRFAAPFFWAGFTLQGDWR